MTSAGGVAGVEAAGTGALDFEVVAGGSLLRQER